MSFETKDSGKREQYDSGMVRDTEEGKARFDLLIPKGVPYANQMLTRFAELMARGAKKYGDRNWEKARGQKELDRYESSALRHLQQWANGEEDEDHAAAVMFNVMAGETVKFKMRTSEELDLATALDHVLDPEAGADGHEDRDGCMSFLRRQAGWVDYDLDQLGRDVLGQPYEEPPPCCDPDCQKCGPPGYQCSACKPGCECRRRDVC